MGQIVGPMRKHLPACQILAAAQSQPAGSGLDQITQGINQRLDGAAIVLQRLRDEV